jgi:phytoene synthase
MKKFREDDYQKSDQLLISKGKSFYWARFFLINKYAVRATRLYGFCRLIDDIADEASSANFAREQLAIIVRDLKANSSNDSRVQDALALFQECGIDLVLPLELITGVLSDLDPVRIKNDAQLIRYCYRVAGTVGLMMSEVLDVKNTNAFYHAIDLGIAMQLTNIARDVREDSTLDRRYIPADLIGATEPSLLVDPTENFKLKIAMSVEHLLVLAEKYYESGNNGLPFLPLGARIAIFIAGRVYRRIGLKIKKNGFNIWSQRTIVLLRTKIIMTILIMISLPFRGYFWQYRNVHDTGLHAYLSDLPFTHSLDPGDV